jgi:hypothetical protein
MIVDAVEVTDQPQPHHLQASLLRLAALGGSRESNTSLGGVLADLRRGPRHLRTVSRHPLTHHASTGRPVVAEMPVPCDTCSRETHPVTLAATRPLDAANAHPVANKQLRMSTAGGVTWA